ncbi:hypothetical protein T03_4123 [Trichinella britovi]|uniref:E3 ubiquitin-protein ligase RBBP6 n=1 Tax=Trichinella britovi TaxID=45882 RepID=A0A0V1DFR4_TRIBR|nr:hypothetical protein T03_4123 [Trichinella britovi]
MEPSGKDTQMKQLRSMEIRKKNQNGIIYESVAKEKGTAFKTSHLVWRSDETHSANWTIKKDVRCTGREQGAKNQRRQPCSNRKYTGIIGEKEKKRTTENLTEEEKIMLMMKESTEAYDPKYYVKIPQRKRKSAWSSYCKRCRQEGHCIQNCPLPQYERAASRGNVSKTVGEQISVDQPRCTEEPVTDITEAASVDEVESGDEVPSRSKGERSPEVNLVNDSTGRSPELRTYPPAPPGWLFQ